MPAPNHGVTCRDVMTIRILSILLLLAGNHAVACSFQERTDEQKFLEADRVFRAKIIATKLINENFDGETEEVVKATYKLIESYKGKNPKKGIVKEIPFGPGNCMLGLLTGMEYVIYLEGNNFVTLPSGSWGYFNAQGTKVVPELNKLRKLSSENM